jgi:hypothetical protein
MKAPPTLSIAVSAVRLWTRLYTWRLPPALREARRAEIESDLWESQCDAQTRSAPSALRASRHMLGRLIRGIPDDLVWRAEHMIATRRLRPRTIALTAIAAAVLLAVLWAIPLLTPGELPTPRPIRKFVQQPPPPPPPPPPCPPSALGGCTS